MPLHLAVGLSRQLGLGQPISFGPPESCDTTPVVCRLCLANSLTTMPIGLRIMFEDTTEKTLRIGIGLVAFNRHDHFAKVLDALEANDHDLDTILFVDRAARRDPE